MTDITQALGSIFSSFQHINKFNFLNAFSTLGGVKLRSILKTA